MGMKSVKITFFLSLLGLTLMVASCKKDSKAPQTPASGSTLTYKINGVAKTTTIPMAAYYKSQSTLQISGGQGTEGVSLMIENPKVGTFDVVTDNILAQYVLDSNNPVTACLGSAGTVVITTFNDTTVAGTFQFSGVDGNNKTDQITGGSFNLKITTITQ
jgi:hypothetical protein